MDIDTKDAPRLPAYDFVPVGLILVDPPVVMRKNSIAGILRVISNPGMSLSGGRDSHRRTHQIPLAPQQRIRYAGMGQTNRRASH